MIRTAHMVGMAVIGAIMTLCGCVNFRQGADEVLIRDPEIGRYGDPVSAATPAKEQWEYAALSENAYREGKENVRAKRKEFERSLVYSAKMTQADFEAACKDDGLALPVAGWRKWDFPSKDLQARMLKEGMYVEVLERTEHPRTIVVIFEGTNFTDLPDWKANLRWFLRFIPGIEDQYILAAKYLASEFYDVITSPRGPYKINTSTHNLETADGKRIKVIATGHSLGGGLAQHFAYVFKQPEQEPYGPKVDEVFAFDPSPVTGWFSSKNPPRNYNATGLRIHRIFEHGEILAYLRLLTSRLAVTSQDPAIWEYSYNFDAGTGLVANHSMRRLACGLIRAAEPWSDQSKAKPEGNR
ncbi:MAG: lipase family protein [Nitrospiraceae bacterium]